MVYPYFIYSLQWYTYCWAGHRAIIKRILIGGLENFEAKFWGKFWVVDQTQHMILVGFNVLIESDSQSFLNNHELTWPVTKWTFLIYHVSTRNTRISSRSNLVLSGVSAFLFPELKKLRRKISENIGETNREFEIYGNIRVIQFWNFRLTSGSISFKISIFYRKLCLNSYGTESGKCLEIVKTLHVKFFPSGSLLPNGPVAVKN